MRRTSIKGYKVTKSKSGKTVLEAIPCFKLSVSARIASRKKIKASKRVPG